MDEFIRQGALKNSEILNQACKHENAENTTLKQDRDDWRKMAEDFSESVLDAQANGESNHYLNRSLERFTQLSQRKDK